ncbi:hypothetical protein F53441_7506 [Fusarium austroafricanum]|uniref:DUF7918 domain-containing protein n=1 Tax=Fusarium austroafricanum TaxID=2364996 RepID=A0A8H4KD61_9HYPO|nr:hypothetical protein F53441_7506 [Fusarium austroafricanum]
MAVLREVPHVSARIRVAGELATEYDPLVDEETVANTSREGSQIPTRYCYIESTSGAEFSVEVTASHDFKFPQDCDSLVANVYLDGQWMTSRIAIKPQGHAVSITVTISDIKCSSDTSGHSVFKKFVFAPITKNSDSITSDKATKDIKRAETLGVIHLILEAGQHKGSMDRKLPIRHDSVDLELAEKALKGKAISHATSLGGTTERPRPQWVRIVNRRSVGEFFFRYRSYQALQHEMIIPRTPSPEPSAATSLNEDDLSRLSESEIRRLALERLRDAKVKDESARVKREADETLPVPRQWKLVKINDGKEAVDLTDD